MRTLPRSGGAGAGSARTSTLRPDGGDGDDGTVDPDEQAEGEGGTGDEDGDEDSRFGTFASYRTARSSGGTSRPGDVRGLWSAEGGSEVEVGEEVRPFPRRALSCRAAAPELIMPSAPLFVPFTYRSCALLPLSSASRVQLSRAIANLEASIDDWSLPGGLGPFVAELGGDDDADEGRPSK
ncbi:hypothetical protein DMC30DRAFT_405916 [Rhodotorula diobovata]|uniref:Uncharacterized protein n=1 Tax=Rhodotorula diobovata TaxID=5288 RepID=A0A5C5FJX9_9BASI|nr:hypothetical protein DMC30DRAFT_406898 [Rhodotorula diobovata]TNY17397.1 hypothetical protein DMC30DRAFT_405916 [Rhodotorula diobovata]